jgi:hypothetical protein
VPPIDVRTAELEDMFSQYFKPAVAANELIAAWDWSTWSPKF